MGLIPEGKVTNWNQVDPSFPDQRLRIYGPTTSSGTFDYFTEAIMGEGGAHRGDLDLATEEDPLIANGVNGTPGGIGYFGLAYLEQYRSLVNAVSVENPDTGDVRGARSCVRWRTDSTRLWRGLSSST